MLNSKINIKNGVIYNYTSSVIQIVFCLLVSRILRISILLQFYNDCMFNRGAPIETRVVKGS